MNKEKPKSSVAGRIYGDLQIIDIDPKKYISKSGKPYKKYLCRCLNCGCITSVVLSNLYYNNQKKCGQCDVINILNKDIYNILDSPYSHIEQTEEGYKAYVANEYIGTFDTAKKAWAAKKMAELILLTGIDIDFIDK